MKTNILIYLKSFSFYKRFIISFFVLSNIILWVKNFSYFYELIKISDSFYSGLYDAIISIYDISNTYDIKNLIIILISIILSSINISLLLKYLDLQKVVTSNINNNLNKNKKDLVSDNVNKSSIKKQSTFTSTALFLAFIASHCASCGAALFGSFISLAFLSYLPFGGLEIGVISIVFLIYLNYDIIKKINSPYTC